MRQPDITRSWWRRIRRLRPYRVTIKMEWDESPDYVATSVPEVWAQSKDRAAAKAILMAQRGVEFGWRRIIVQECVAI